jgi:hypothetical protein
MRLIERKMIAAIHERKDWKCDNTRVICTQFVHSDHIIDRVSVILHGSTIAIITPTDVDVSDCGWQTPTTKSRLNAILREFCGAGIYQKNQKRFACAEGEKDWEVRKGSRQLFYRGEG